ncbi:unnamed protein product [Diamesa hyperborea]
MSKQLSENDSEDDDCEYFLQPTNQYNITEKIKEANQELYSESVLRASSPKVKFREKLVEFEPEFDEDGNLMEKRSNSSNSSHSHRKEEESSDDGYVEETHNNNNNNTNINENNSDVVMNESNVNSEDIEEVCEQLDGELEISEKEENSDVTENVPEESEDYFKSDFNEEEHEEACNSPELPREPTIIRKCCEDRDRKPDVQKCFPKRIFSHSKSTKISPITTDVSNDVTNLCRNKVKTCCKHKESEEYKQKLPKYNGAHSNYGLSLEEIAKRQRKEHKSIHIKQRKEEQQFEQKELLSKNNEEAFAKWLYKKMRNPVNKSNRSNPINMFDVKYTKSYKPNKSIQRESSTEEQDVDEEDEN